MRVPSSLSSLSSSLSGISLLRNLGAQALERPREPRLDGSSRATQDRGHLLFGQPIAHRASSRRPPRASSNSSRRSAARTAPSGEEGLFSGVPSRAAQEQTGATGGRPALVSGLVGDYGEQPGPETGGGPESPQGVIRLHEGLLGCFLSLRSVACDEVSGTEGHLLAAAYQPLIRRSVSTLRPLCELRLIRGDGPSPRRRSLPPSTTPGAKRFPA